MTNLPDSHKPDYSQRICRKFELLEKAPAKRENCKAGSFNCGTELMSFGCPPKELMRRSLHGKEPSHLHVFFVGHHRRRILGLQSPHSLKVFPSAAESEVILPDSFFCGEIPMATPIHQTTWRLIPGALRRFGA
jgi:hypothetical protein